MTRTMDLGEVSTQKRFEGKECENRFRSCITTFVLNVFIFETHAHRAGVEQGTRFVDKDSALK